MKIGAITISLIIIFLMVFYSYYTDKKILDMQVDSCNKVAPPRPPADTSLFSDSDNERWGDCLVQQQIYRTKYSLTMSMTFILFMLVLLSLRIDFLENKSK